MHPVLDFFLLGGATLVIAPIILLLPDSSLPWVAGISLFVANFINHPHFAHSYQIFYENFTKKLSGATYPTTLKIRYGIAGIVVPIALVSFMAFCIATGEKQLLGYTGNVMGFLVGWHYVKQGYGMLVVQSVIHKRFFSESEKLILRWNAYACWMFSWLLLTSVLGQRSLFGFEHYLLEINPTLLKVSAVGAVLTSLLTVMTIGKKAMANGGAVAWTGITAYAITLYVWLLAALDPLLIFVVPALHSLQYLTVVWRFEMNRANATSDDQVRFREAFGKNPKQRFVRFILIGTLLGYMGFNYVPSMLDSNIAFTGELAGYAVMLFVFWIFINIHHYFIDNVIWRKDNKETSTYLFSSFH